MAEPTLVNGQITDSVTQSNIATLANSPAMAINSLYQSLAHSLGIAFENAVSSQQNSNSVSSAVTTTCVETLLNRSKV